jgi:UDP-glucuronate 4-epimerase
MTASPGVLVTGAAGFIGSHVCEALVARGERVTGVDAFDPFYPRAVKERNLAGLRGAALFRLVEANVARDPIPLDDVAVIVHLAAKAGVRPSWDDPAGYLEANVTATARLLDAAGRAGVTRVVLASSSSVYGDDTPAPCREDAPALEPVSPYGASKRAAELVALTFARRYGLRVAVLRYFTVYGPRQRPDLAIHKFTDLVAHGGAIPVYGDGSTSRDYTYISDAVAATLAAVAWTERASPGACEVFNVGGGAPVRLDRLIALLADAWQGREVRIERQPEQPGDVRATAADLTRAERVLGYRPRVPIAEGLRHFVRWYEETYGRER